MDKTMTPSQMTERQIDKAVASYRAMLEKYAPQFGSEPVQQALGQSELAKDMFNLFRVRVEAVSSLITRSAPVDRTRTSKEAMVATGRTPHLNDVVLTTMPRRGVGNHVEQMYYCFGRTIACDKLDDELAKLGFELDVDAVGQAAINEADPEFADKYPNGTQWKNADDKYCCAVFVRWNDERRVYVGQYDSDWDDHWWFPVRRK